VYSSVVEGQYAVNSSRGNAGWFRDTLSQVCDIPLDTGSEQIADVCDLSTGVIGGHIVNCHVEIAQGLSRMSKIGRGTTVRRDCLVSVGLHGTDAMSQWQVLLVERTPTSGGLVLSRCPSTFCQ